MQAWQQDQHCEAHMQYVLLETHRNMKTCTIKVYSTGAEQANISSIGIPVHCLPAPFRPLPVHLLLQWAAAQSGVG